MNNRIRTSIYYVVWCSRCKYYFCFRFGDVVFSRFVLMLWYFILLSSLQIRIVCFEFDAEPLVCLLSFWVDAVVSCPFALMLWTYIPCSWNKLCFFQDIYTRQNIRIKDEKVPETSYATYVNPVSFGLDTVVATLSVITMLTNYYTSHYNMPAFITANVINLFLLR